MAMPKIKYRVEFTARYFNTEKNKLESVKRSVVVYASCENEAKILGYERFPGVHSTTRAIATPII